MKKVNLNNFIKKLLITVILIFQVNALTIFAEEKKEHQKQENQKNEHSSLDQPKKSIKDWNLIVYLAANNNLHSFSIKNLQQMIHVGSTDSINILAQLDGYRQREVTRYYIEHKNPIVMSSMDYSNETISGTKESLYSFVKWAVETYPARHQCLILWNHGSGIKDPHIWGKQIMSRRDEFYFFNYDSGLLELNRKLLDNDIDEFLRGIAFNDTYETYLTNQELTETLDNISQKLLGGKKIDLLCMDACHMAMIEVGSQVKSAVEYMIGSQEIEPGSGYNYIYLLAPFVKGTLTVEEFAKQAVSAYVKEYRHFNADYTQSAVNLNNFKKLEGGVHKTSKALIDLIKQNDNDIIIKILKSIRLSGRYTTEFYDPDYIDLCHFYKSLSKKINHLLEKGSLTDEIKQKFTLLKNLSLEILNSMQNYIIKNSSGMNLPFAYGLSIYFPKNFVDTYYYKTIFDRKTGWSNFLHKYQKHARRLQKHSSVQTRKTKKETYNIRHSPKLAPKIREFYA